MTRFLLLVCLTSLPALAFEPPPTRPSKPTAPAAKSPQFAKISKEAEAARDANKLDEAIALYAKAVELDPKWVEGWWYLGTILYEQNHFSDARLALRNVVALNEKMAAGWALLGLCEFEVKEYEQAAAHLDQARLLGLPPDGQLNEVTRYHLGLLLTHFQRYDQAIAILSAMAQAKEASPQVIEALGIAGLRKPLLPAEVSPEDREVVYMAGKAIADSAGRNGRQAQSEFEALVKKYPQTKMVHYLYGSFLLFGEPDAGIKELEKELEISPESTPVLVQLANEYLKRGESAKALAYSEQAVKSEPDSFVTRSFYGRCLVENGELEKGIGELEKAEKAAPDSPQIRILLASAYSKAGRKEDASRERTEFQRLKSLVKAP